MDTPAKTVTEGKATVFTPQTVFYNPVQEFNRDLTVLVITEHIKDHYAKLREKTKTSGKNGDAAQSVDGTSDDALSTPDLPGVKCEQGVRILEALAASGLRSVRFALEIPGVNEIVANDFDAKAVDFIKKNVQHNNVEHLVTPSQEDATLLLYKNRSHKDRFDVIDLDPYGTPAQFIDGAVQAVKDSGLLCVTCTDMAILCGNTPEAAYSKYGAMPLKAKYCHEMALRIVLQSIEKQANRYSRYIVPMLSISADFYCRVFVRVYTSQREVKNVVMKLSMVYHCVGCGVYNLQPLATRSSTKGPEFKYTPARAPTVPPLCEHCNSKLHLGGPIWTAPIHDREFVSRALASMDKHSSKFNTAGRMKGTLTVMGEELPEVPLYYVSDELSKLFHCNAIKFLDLRSALLNAGYDVSLSHANRCSIKTNAPAALLFDFYRHWAKSNGVTADKIKEGRPGRLILSKKPEHEPDFTLHPQANPASRSQGLLRWQPNPERDWGPKPRARQQDGETLDERRNKGEEKARGKRKRQDIDLKQFPCKRHRQGLCTLGDTCRYSHEDGDMDTNAENRPGSASSVESTDEMESTAEPDSPPKNA